MLRLCAAGQLAIDLRGLELLQAQPGESADAAWMRIKGKVGSGRELEQTILLTPSASPQSGGAVPTPTEIPVAAPVTLQELRNSDIPSNLFAVGESKPPPAPIVKPYGTPPKTPVNLLGEVEKWGISAASSVSNININVSRMTGAQLTELLKKLPDGVTYALNLEKETP